MREVDTGIQIDKFINKIIREYRKKRVVKGMITGLLTGVIILFLLYLMRIIINLDIKPIMVLALPILLGGILGFSLSINIPVILSRADKFMNLEEMLITYKEYIQKEEANIFLPLIKKRLASAIDKRKAKGIFKIKVERELRITAVIIIALLFLSIWMDFSGNYQKEIEYKDSLFLVEKDDITAYEEEEDKLSPETQSSPEEIKRDLFEVSEVEFDLQLSKLENRSDELEETGGNFEDLERGEDNNMVDSDDFSSEDNEERSRNVSDLEKGDGTEESDEQTQKSIPTSDEDEGSESQSEKGGGSDSQSEKDEKDQPRSDDFSPEPENSDDKEHKEQVDSYLPTGKEDASDENVGEGSVLINDDRFNSTDQEYSKSKLESIVNSIYVNYYIEELMRPDIEGDKQNVNIEDLIKYRDYMINSLEDVRIPAGYKNMVREYFKRIIKE